jgi:hypothetical protein
MSEKEIKIGRTSFSKEMLSSISLEEAEIKFNYIDKRILSEAWKIANPKGKKPSKPKKKNPKKKEKND